MNLFNTAGARAAGRFAALLIAPLAFASGSSVHAGEQRPGDAKLVGVLLKISADHPRIVERAGELAARLAAARYSSGRYPDPNLGVAWSNYPYKKDLRLIDDRTPMTGVEFSVAQPIPFPGRLTLESQIADVEARAGRLRLAIEKNQIAREFLEQMTEARALRGDLRLVQKFGERMRIASDVVNARYAVGKASLADLSEARVRQAVFQDRARKLEGALQSRYRSLRYYLADSHEAAANSGPADVPQAGPPERLAAWLTANDIAEPDGVDRYLGRLRSRVMSDDANIEGESLAVALVALGEDRRTKEESLAWMGYLPDFEVFASYRRRANIPDDPAAGEDFMSFGFKMRVPLWSALNNHNQLTAAEEQTKSARFAERNSIERETRAFDAARIDLLTLEDRLALYNESLIPGAERGLSAARFAYESGRGGFDAFVSAWQTLYGLQSEGLRLRADRDRTVLAMAFALNTILPDISERPIEGDAK